MEQPSNGLRPGLLGAAGTLIALANALLALRVKNQWFYKGSSMALALASLTFVGFGVATGMLSQSLNY